ncbi:hypothetical protein THRCLA_06696, partial [Thraustotheca clavata]
MPGMKVAVVQFEPLLMEVERNMTYAANMLSKYTKDGKLDIVLLCEMAFTGYCFKNRQEIEPFAETPTGGRTFAWCSDQAKRLNCLIGCGYVEKTTDNSPNAPLYNSLMLVSPEGQLVYNARKHFLYIVDTTWATPSPDGFGTWYCPWLKQNITFGICMDINAFEEDWPVGKYELANKAVAENSSLILFSSAWDDLNPDEPSSDSSWETIEYWIGRLTPMTESLMKDKEKNCHFICSNRIGTERGTQFVGGSCIVSLRDKKVLGSIGRYEEGVLYKFVVVQGWAAGIGVPGALFPAAQTIVQYLPTFGNVQENMHHISTMLLKYSESDKIDILMLSEMVFTGYCFKDRTEIEPFAELNNIGPTFSWCKSQALRLNCLVACGYVEKTLENNNLYN